MPGTYTVALMVNGQRAAEQNFIIKMDPRVKTPVAALQKQHDLSLQCYEARKKCMAMMSSGNQDLALARLSNGFASLFNILQESDMAPTQQTVSAAAELQKQLNELLKK